MKRLVEEELEEKRRLLQKRNVAWDLHDVAHAQFLYIGVQTERWGPRRPIIEGGWFPQTRRFIQASICFIIIPERYSLKYIRNQFFSDLFQKRKVSELTDMNFCQRHMCRSGPAEVAHFDCELQERGEVSFSGILEICVNRGKSMLRTRFDMYPVCV